MSRCRSWTSRRRGCSWGASCGSSSGRGSTTGGRCTSAAFGRLSEILSSSGVLLISSSGWHWADPLAELPTSGGLPGGAHFGVAMLSDTTMTEIADLMQAVPEVLVSGLQSKTFQVYPCFKIKNLPYLTVIHLQLQVGMHSLRIRIDHG